MIKNTSVLISGALLVMAWQAAWGDYQAGLRAYDRKDYLAAYEQWQFAADEGDMQAQYRLAQLYEQGQGAIQSSVAAYTYYYLAYRRGHAQALAALRRVATSMPPEQLLKARGMNPGASQVDRQVHASQVTSNVPDNTPGPVSENPLGDAALTLLPAGTETLPVTVPDIGQPIPSTNPDPVTTPANPWLESDTSTPKALTQTVQGLLNELGYHVGQPDGVSGGRTRDAIQRYQRRAEQAVDGQSSEALVTSLRQSVTGNHHRNPYPYPGNYFALPKPAKFKEVSGVIYKHAAIVPNHSVKVKSYQGQGAGTGYQCQNVFTDGILYRSKCQEQGRGQSNETSRIYAMNGMYLLHGNKAVAIKKINSAKGRLFPLKENRQMILGVETADGKMCHAWKVVNEMKAGKFFDEYYSAEAHPDANLKQGKILIVQHYRAPSSQGKDCIQKSNQTEEFYYSDFLGIAIGSYNRKSKVFHKLVEVKTKKGKQYQLFAP